MNTFEQNLEVLKKSLEEGSETFDKKSERLIREMQVQFRKGAVCPLAQPHMEFINILMAYGEIIPVQFTAWAEGVDAYEIALQRPGSGVNTLNQVSAPKPVSQSAIKKDGRTEPIKADEGISPPDKTETPVKTNGIDDDPWTSDL